MHFKQSLKTVDEVDKKLIEFVMQEKTNTEMAKGIGYSVGFVKRRLNYLFKLFGVKTRVGLIREVFKFDKSLLDT